MQLWKFKTKTYACPITMTAHLIGARWRTNVMWYIAKGTNRFSQLTKALPMINQGVMMRVLRELEADGLVSRRESGKRPAPVEYSLTELGDSLVPLLAEMAEWGRKHGTQAPVADA